MQEPIDQPKVLLVKLRRKVEGAAMSRFRIVFVLLMIVIVIIATSVTFSGKLGSDNKSTLLNYIILIMTLVGFSMTLYQLRETELSIRESIEKPHLLLEVAASTGVPGEYYSQATGQLQFRRVDGERCGTNCVVKITNTGNKAASNIYLSFILRPADTSKISNLKVLYNGSQFVKPVYVDCDVRNGVQVGWTLRLPNDVIVYAPNDRIVVAELTLIVDQETFESNYCIQYEIYALEGNSAMTSPQSKLVEGRAALIYPVNFELVEY